MTPYLFLIFLSNKKTFDAFLFFFFFSRIQLELFLLTDLLQDEDENSSNDINLEYL